MKKLFLIAVPVIIAVLFVITYKSATQIANPVTQISENWGVYDMAVDGKSVPDAPEYLFRFKSKLEISLEKWGYNEDEPKVFTGRYDMFIENDKLYMEISRFNDEKFNGIYNVYLDTVAKSKKNYIITFVLENDKNFLGTSMEVPIGYTLINRFYPKEEPSNHIPIGLP